jgi:hypothetical protein
MDPTAKFVACGKDKDNKPLPDLLSSSSKHWPHNYATAMGWYQTSTGYIFSLPLITATQMTAKLESCRVRYVKMLLYHW